VPRRAAAKSTEPDADALVITDAPTLKALAEPVRLQILMELGETAKTVKEVANTLEMGTTRLYYHFKILERAGLIRVAGRRMVSGIEERSYRATATSWTAAPESNPALVESGLIDALLEVVRAELELALGAQGDVPLGEPGSAVPVISFTRLALDDDDVAELQRRVEQVMLDFGETGPAPEGKRLYHALFAGYQAPFELRARNEGASDAPPTGRGARAKEKS
jgi:DNA-binding transcriptional ArsR family regulator